MIDLSWHLFLLSAKRYFIRLLRVSSWSCFFFLFAMRLIVFAFVWILIILGHFLWLISWGWKLTSTVSELLLLRHFFFVRYSLTLVQQHSVRLIIFSCLCPASLQWCLKSLLAARVQLVKTYLAFGAKVLSFSQGWLKCGNWAAPALGEVPFLVGLQLFVIFASSESDLAHTAPSCAYKAIDSSVLVIYQFFIRQSWCWRWVLRTIEIWESI